MHNTKLYFSLCSNPSFLYITIKLGGLACPRKLEPKVKPSTVSNHHDASILPGATLRRLEMLSSWIGIY